MSLFLYFGMKNRKSYLNVYTLTNRQYRNIRAKLDFGQINDNKLPFKGRKLVQNGDE